MSYLSTLELWPLTKIKLLLDEKLGEAVWLKFEPETIMMELSVEATPLLVDKLCLLTIIGTSPNLVYLDPALFLYATSVVNNESADFSSIPHVTLLETAYAIHSIDRTLLANKVTPTYPDALVKTCAYIMRNEGCSKPLHPFIFVPQSELEKGQTEEDTSNKKKAIAMYLIHMDSL